MDFSQIMSGIFVSIAVLGLCVGVVVSMIRQALEFLFKKLATSFIWREAILPALPFAVGCLIWIVYNKVIHQELQAYLVLLGSFSSSYFYRLFQSYLKKAALQVEKDADDEIKKADQSAP